VRVIIHIRNGEIAGGAGGIVTEIKGDVAGIFTGKAGEAAIGDG